MFNVIELNWPGVASQLSHGDEVRGFCLSVSFVRCTVCECVLCVETLAARWLGAVRPLSFSSSCQSTAASNSGICAVSFLKSIRRDAVNPICLSTVVI
jgi:hypothetical protein